MRVTKRSLSLLLTTLTFAACGGGGGGGAANAITPSASLSSFVADRASAPADGTTEVLLTAIVRDVAGDALGGRTVRFEATGAGAVLQPTQATANANGVATARLTSTVPGPVTVSALVSPGSDSVRLDATVTVTFVDVDAPVVAGIARFEDADRDGTASVGDRVVVPFSKPVVVNGASASDFVLPVEDDTFGTGASVTAGPLDNEVTITLGSQARLRTRGAFAAALVTTNEPSGIDVQNGQGIASAAEGVPAAASAPIDIAPAPVAAATVAAGGDDVAFGDLDGDGDDDVLVAGNGQLQALVNTGGELAAPVAFSSSAARDVAVANLNRIGAAEAVTAEAAGVQVWNNTAIGGSAPALGQAALVPTGDTYAVLLVDVNDDGFPDIVAGTASGVVVALHQRNLGNSFQAVQTVPLATLATHLAAADLDGDGDLDVLAAQGAAGVRRLINDGGSLSDGGALVAAGAGSIAAGDLDRDGRVDLAVATQGTVTLLRNTGAGFTSSTVAVPAAQVELVEVDGDGFVDLVVRDTDGITLLQNDRSGGFAAFAAIEQAGVAGLAALDLDDDGDADLVAVDSAQTRPFRGSRTGTFGDSTFVPTADLGQDAIGVQQLADLDADGRVDRVVATANGAQVWFGDGEGSFSVGTTFGTAQPQAIALGDLDGDLDVDCVLGFDGTNQVFLNDGSGAFAFAVDFAAGSDTRSFGLTDFDQDGDLDVFVGNDGQNQLFLTDVVPGGVSLTENLDAFLGLLPQAQVGETIAVLVFDFDREGDEDLILVNGGEINAPQDAYVLRRSGTGYTLLTTLSAQLLATAATLGDIDGDGRPDVVVAQVSPAGNATVKWFRGLATSLATLSANIATNGQFFSRSLVVADLDGDGRSDVLVGDVSVSNQPLVVLRQQPNGSFALAQEVPTTRLESFGAADLDLDGDIDVVTSESTGPSRVLANR